jgi:4-hydroxythreonine-4-phosphate dehydrogenase
MMLIGGPLRVSLVTRHIRLSDVSKKLTAKNIGDTIKLTLNALKTDFGIPRPKIGVSALNPHAGDGGMFGDEEERIIAPAVRRFRKFGVRGPFPADSVFYDAYNGRLDCVICLYHDQGLIPLKMIARDNGVNITLGLGFVRTSPDHGTAFDIAGGGKANPSSMEIAIKTAADMVLNRKANALKKRD